MGSAPRRPADRGDSRTTTAAASPVLKGSSRSRSAAAASKWSVMISFVSSSDIAKIASALPVSISCAP